MEVLEQTDHIWTHRFPQLSRIFGNDRRWCSLITHPSQMGLNPAVVFIFQQSITSNMTMCLMVSRHRYPSHWHEVYYRSYRNLTVYEEDVDSVVCEVDYQARLNVLTDWKCLMPSFGTWKDFATLIAIDHGEDMQDTTCRQLKDFVCDTEHCPTNMC